MPLGYGKWPKTSKSKETKIDTTEKRGYKKPKGRSLKTYQNKINQLKRKYRKLFNCSKKQEERILELYHYELENHTLKKLATKVEKAKGVLPKKKEVSKKQSCETCEAEGDSSIEYCGSCVVGRVESNWRANNTIVEDLARNQAIDDCAIALAGRIDEGKINVNKLSSAICFTMARFYDKDVPNPKQEYTLTEFMELVKKNLPTP